MRSAATEITHGRRSVARPGRLRRLTPLVTLIIPTGLIGAAAGVWLWWPCGTGVCARPLSVVWVLVMMAVPTAILLGLPWTISVVTVTLATITSLLLWMWIGLAAARRATRDVDAGWPSVFAELVPVAFGLWAGLAGGLMTMTIFLSI